MVCWLLALALWVVGLEGFLVSVGYCGFIVWLGLGVFWVGLSLWLLSILVWVVCAVDLFLLNCVC